MTERLQIESSILCLTSARNGCCSRKISQLDSRFYSDALVLKRAQILRRKHRRRVQ